MTEFWYVLHVKPRTEKKVFSYLEKYRCIRHLPLYVKVTRVQRRKVRRLLPLFPGYVFARLPPEKRLMMLQTNLIASLIAVDRPRQMVHQLRQVTKVTRNEAALRIVAKEFHEGDLVRIVTGPFSGTEGVLARDGSGTHLCLNISVLGTSVHLQVSSGDVERVPKK